MENEKLLGEQIVVFSWMGSTFAAFDLFFSPDLRLRINKKSFWRISHGDTVLYSSADRMDDKRISEITRLLEGKTVKGVTERRNGDIILRLNKNVKIELFSIGALERPTFIG